MPDHVTISKKVLDGLCQAERHGFSERTIEEGAVYDLRVPGADRISAKLASAVLSLKNSIDTSTIDWLCKARAEFVGKTDPTSFRGLFEWVFTPDEMFFEIVSRIREALDRAFAPIRFRVSYARPVNSDSLAFKYGIGLSKDDFRYSVNLNSCATAALAFKQGRSEFVASTRAELRRPEAERRFTLLYKKQDVERLASIACFPVSEPTPDDSGPRVFGVVCVDTHADGFFRSDLEEAFNKVMESMLSELLIVEQFVLLLAQFPTPASTKPRKTRAAKTPQGG